MIHQGPHVVGPTPFTGGPLGRTHEPRLNPIAGQSALLEDLARLSRDPLAFVMWAFPWGEAQTELEGFKGPEPWQRQVLENLRAHLNTERAILEAIASGHGIGKSALVSWIILWALSTFPDTRGVVTANTETQLKTKTWVELNKWFRLFIAKSLFEITATKICSADPSHADTWRIDIVPWSERNTEAFAGLHNKGKRVLVIYDEASAIPDVIWETTEGALTDADTEIIWLVCGNPTRNTGRFRDCFTRLGGLWHTTQVDAREVSITNKSQIERWIDNYGEDSDFVRVRVRGIFPRVGAMEFISAELVSEAARRDFYVHPHDPFIIGVDVARFGDDESVIFFRKGRDGRSIAPIRLRGVDTMTLAGRVSEEYLRYRADAIFVDGGGVGGGVVDRLRQLRVPCFDIQFGAKADRSNIDDQSRYANKRAEMWGYMREWLKGGAIPNDPDLVAQISTPMYSFNGQNEIQLERKEDIKKRMGTSGTWSSPDLADALALTFAYPVVSTSMAGREGAEHLMKPPLEHEYNPFDEKVLAA